MVVGLHPQQHKQLKEIRAEDNEANRRVWISPVHPPASAIIRTRLHWNPVVKRDQGEDSEWKNRHLQSWPRVAPVGETIKSNHLSPHKRFIHPDFLSTRSNQTAVLYRSNGPFFCPLTAENIFIPSIYVRNTSLSSDMTFLLLYSHQFATSNSLWTGAIFTWCRFGLWREKTNICQCFHLSRRSVTGGAFSPMYQRNKCWHCSFLQIPDVCFLVWQLLSKSGEKGICLGW